MGDLIFVLPTFIIFFFIIAKILLLFKRVFDLTSKKFNLTIEEADAEMKNGQKMNFDYDQNEVKEKISEAEKEALAENKKRILKQQSESRNKEQNSINVNRKNKELENLNQNQGSNKNSSLAEIFAQYNELEKAVIYNEILSKPKALKRD